MVLAFTPETSSLDKLAELADKVLEVAAPAVSAVKLPSEVSTEIEQLRTEVSGAPVLLVQLLPLQVTALHLHMALLNRPLLPQMHPHCVGILPNWGKELEDADLLVTVS